MSRLAAAVGSAFTLLVVIATATSPLATAANSFGPPNASGAWTARLVAATRVAATPGGARLQTLQPLTPATGSSVTLLVLGSVERQGDVWLQSDCRTGPTTRAAGSAGKTSCLLGRRIAS